MKFKVGDTVRLKAHPDIRGTVITSILPDGNVLLKDHLGVFLMDELEEDVTPATERAGELKKGEDNMISIVDNRKEETPELPYFRRTKGGCLVLYYEGEDGKVERVWMGEVNREMKIKRVDSVEWNNICLSPAPRV